MGAALRSVSGPVGVGRHVGTEVPCGTGRHPCHPSAKTMPLGGSIAYAAEGTLACKPFRQKAKGLLPGIQYRARRHLAQGFRQSQHQRGLHRRIN